MNILTFDIEEWFHLLYNESTKTINEWKKWFFVEFSGSVL